MNPTLIVAIVLGALLGAVFLGSCIRRLIPEHHLRADTKETVKLAMGLVATMCALLLGLLVSSAKDSYDTTRSEVIQMAAKVAFVDRILADYGPEAREARVQFRATIEQAVGRMWPGEGSRTAHLAPNTQAVEAEAVYAAIQNLSPRDDMQRTFKAQVVTLTMDLGQLKSLLLAQLSPSVSMPLLIVVCSWLVVIFFSFALLAPPNATATLALVVAAFSVAGAIFLILELDRPFGGVIQISSEPMLNALRLMAK